MKILLAGGNSTLAQVLKPILEPFAEVTTAGRSGCDVKLDLAWPIERFAIPAGIDVVINLAAHFGGASATDFLAAEEINVLGTLKLANACTRVGVAQLIQISSISACLGNESIYFGAYALSKRHADEALRLYCANEGLSCAILRPSQLYGESEGFRKHQPFIYNALDRVVRGEDIVIYGGRGALRNYLHADDFCRLIIATIQQRIEGIYQCTSEENIGLDALANQMILASGQGGRVVFDRSKVDIPDNIFPYDDTLYRLTGVYPEIGMAAGVDRLVSFRMSAK